MKFFSAVAPLALALSPSINNAKVHLSYHDGAANLVRELFMDYNWPDLVAAAATGGSFLDGLTDAAVISCLQTGTLASIASFKNNNNDNSATWTQYLNVANCMSTSTFARSDIQTYFANFNVGSSSNDFAALATTIADAHYVTAQTAADSYVLQTDKIDATDAYITGMKALKGVFVDFNAGIGQSRSTGEVITEILEMSMDFINAGLLIWENSLEVKTAAMKWYYHIIKADEIIVYQPLINACLQKTGPFGLIHEMELGLASLIGGLHTVVAWDTINEAIFNKLIWGQEILGMSFLQWAEKYFFQYLVTLYEYGGKTEAYTNILALTLDPLLDDIFFNMIKGPVCGFE